MQIGKPNLSLRLSFESPAARQAQPGAARRQLRTSLMQSLEKAGLRDARASEAMRTRLDVRSRDGLYQELRGRLDQLKSATEPATFARAAATDAPAALRDVATQVGDLRGLLEGAVGPNGTHKDDELLRDLADAVDGLFVAKGGDRPTTLGDLGVTMGSGEVLIDDAVMEELLARLPDSVAADWPLVVAAETSTLFAQGARALQDKQNQAPLEERLAEQAVHVRAEISRLQARQSMLLHQQVAFEKQQETLKDQQDTLKQTQRRLTEAEDAERGAAIAAEERSAASVAALDEQRPPTISAATTAPQSPGLLSFGMAD